MNLSIAAPIVQGFLKGTFDVINAMLGVTSTHGEPEFREMTASDIAIQLADFPVSLCAQVKSGKGAVALLLTTADAARLTSLVNTGAATAKESLDDEDIRALKEIADPCLGGGISNLQDSLGATIELTEAQVAQNAAPVLAESLGDKLVGAVFTYSIPPGIDSKGAFLLSESLEDQVPGAQQLAGAATGSEPAAAEQPVAQPASEKTVTSSSETASTSATPPPPNLDMILDIRLMATARLGRIEMPIGDILAMGPGSIFEVGRAVDEPIDLMVNDKLIARGDVVVVDEKFGIRITEIVSAKERIESLR